MSVLTAFCSLLAMTTQTCLPSPFAIADLVLCCFLSITATQPVFHLVTVLLTVLCCCLSITTQPVFHLVTVLLTVLCCFLSITTHHSACCLSCASGSAVLFVSITTQPVFLPVAVLLTVLCCLLASPLCLFSSMWLCC